MQAVDKIPVITAGQEQFRLQNFLFVVKFPAVEAVPAHVFNFPGAGLSLVEQAAPPVEINAAFRETGLFLENVINRYPVFKVQVGLMGAFEYIMALVVVYDGL